MHYLCAKQQRELRMLGDRRWGADAVRRLLPGRAPVQVLGAPHFRCLPVDTLTNSRSMQNPCAKQERQFCAPGNHRRGADAVRCLLPGRAAVYLVGAWLFIAPCNPQELPEPLYSPAQKHQPLQAQHPERPTHRCAIPPGRFPYYLLPSNRPHRCRGIYDWLCLVCMAWCTAPLVAPWPAGVYKF